MVQHLQEQTPTCTEVLLSPLLPTTYRNVVLNGHPINDDRACVCMPTYQFQSCSNCEVQQYYSLPLLKTMSSTFCPARGAVLCVCVCVLR